MNLFDAVKSRVTILDVVQEYCTLKKAGSYWKGPCPFHHERTASFTVSPHREIFYCFGCHQGGDVISFIATLEHCSQWEAAQFLIERYQIEVPQTLLAQRTHPSEKKRYEVMCTAIASWCHEQFLKNKPAQDYMQQRGFSQKTSALFQVGYVPKQWLKSLQEFLQKEHIVIQDLRDIHFVLDGKHGLYSPFEERIIFPIHDHLGRVIAFGGRIFLPEDTRPKYYNSHENSYFSKGSLAYGLDKAKQAIKQESTIFLVEGYLDVLAMHQAGLTTTVATLGTACTQEHLTLLGRYVPKLCVLYDGDNAGKQATLRLIKLCMQTSLELEVALLPQKEDPASYLQKNDSIKPVLVSAQDMLTFLIQEKWQTNSKKTIQERLVGIDELIAFLADIKDPLKKNMFLQQISGLFQVPLELILKRISHEKKLVQQSVGPESLIPVSQPLPTIPTLEKKIFSAILKNKGILQQEDEQFLDLHFSPPLDELFHHFKSHKSQHSSDQQSFLSTLAADQKRIISEILLDDADETPESFKLLMGQFQKKQWKLLVNDVKMELSQARDPEQQKALQEKLSDLQLLQKKLIQRGLI